MKYGDKVKLVNETYEYGRMGFKKGMIGEIMEPYINENNEFCVQYFFDFFYDENGDYVPGNSEFLWVKIKDIEIIEQLNISQKAFLRQLDNDATKWCIVEDGFIKNLNGDKKNKIAFDYDS